MTKLVILVALLAILAGVSLSSAYSQILFPATISVQPSQVIDPANNVHTFYLGSSIVGSCTGKCEDLVTSTGKADTSTSVKVGRSTTCCFEVQPDISTATTTATPSDTTPSGFAWVYPADLGGLTVQSGPWHFDTTITASATGTASMRFLVWSCTTASEGGCTLLFDFTGTANIESTTVATKYADVSPVEPSFSNVHYLTVEVWISPTGSTGSNNAIDTMTTVSGASDVITPALGYSRSLSGSQALAASFAEIHHSFKLFVGSFAFTASVHFIVAVSARDFAISANSTSLTIKQKTSGMSNITLTSLNGFTGNIDLSATVSPVVKKGLAASLNPVSLTLTASGHGTSTLTVSARGSTPPGIYTVTVTGVSGTLTHQIQVTVTVIAG